MFNADPLALAGVGDAPPIAFDAYDGIRTTRPVGAHPKKAADTDGQVISMPAIGDTVTTSHARALARQFGLDHVVKAIDANPEAFQPWVFDGMSGCPTWFEELAAASNGVPKDELWKVAMQHDLSYAYGTPGDSDAREVADDQFRDGLAGLGVGVVQRNLAYGAVRLGGAEWMGFDFSWGFARK
jgi:hypothetical protein